MRTREARRMRDKALKYAKQGGHNTQLISKSGAVELYGCLHQGCNDTMDCWDAPAIVNGPRPHRKCSAAAARRSWIQNIFYWIRKII